MKRIALGTVLMTAALPALALGPDVNLSGTFGLSLSWYEDHKDTVDTTDVDVENNGSNFRITAAEQEVGIRAFAVYERGASNDQLGVEDVREFFGGVSAQLGTLVYGRKATDYRLAGQRLDPFYNTSAASFRGLFSAEGASFGLSNLTNGYTSNTIAYASPSLAGVSFNLAAYVNNNDNQTGVGDEADFGIGVAYVNSDWLGLDLGVQALDLNGGNVVTGSPSPPATSTAIRGHASLGKKLWTIGVSYEFIDVAGDADPRQYAFLSGSYQLFEALRLAATVGSVTDTPELLEPPGVGGSLGMFWDVTRNLTAYWALRYVGLDNAVDETNATLAGGVKFVFDVDL